MDVNVQPARAWLLAVFMCAWSLPALVTAEPVSPQATSTRLARRPAAAKLVDQGIQFYYEGRYQMAMKLLKKALRSEGLDETRTLGAMQYQAFCQVALGDPGAARKTFELLLDRKPDFRLPAGTAPKITGLFNEVKKLRAPPPEPSPPALTHTPPGPTAAGKPIVLSAQLAPMPAGGQLVVRYRTRSEGAFSRQSMSPSQGGQYRAILPAPLNPDVPELTYFIYLVDGDGQRLAALGSETQPFRVALNAPPPVEPKQDEGISIHWWIWPVVGAVALGTGLALGLTLSGSNTETGTARITIQPVD